MPNGEGKGWAKGRTAATDPRIARNAAAHTGLRYRLRTHDTRWIAPREACPLTWSPRMAYLVGLMATDGCLARDRRHLAFTSADRDLIETVMDLIGRRHLTPRRKGERGWDVQWSDVGLWRFLESVGLTPAKSLTLGALAVPDELIIDCARGLMDGDGTVANFTHAPTRRTYPLYRYERLIVKFHSASRPHVEWLRAALAGALEITGSISVTEQPSANPEYTLAYGKYASQRLLSAMYADPAAPRLARKYAVWCDYSRRHGDGAEGGT